MERIGKTAERLAEKYGVAYYELRVVRVRSTSISIQNDHLEELSENEEVGLGVRAFKGAWGFSSANDMKRAGEAIETAMKAAKLLKGSASVYVGDPVRDEVAVRQEVPLETLGIDEKLVLVRDAAKALKGEAIKNRSVSYGDSVKEQLYINSTGSEIRTVVPRIRLYIASTAFSSGDMQRYWKAFGGTGGFELVSNLDLNEWGSLVSLKANELLKASSPPAGSFDVVMDPELTGVFIHEALGHAVEADSVKNGESILAGRIGESLGPEELTVVDDPTIPGKFGSYVYDDEGIRGRKVEVIRKGVLREYLTDRETAAHFGVRANGHGRAQDYAHQPLVRMSNTYVEGGTWETQEIIEGVRRGLYMIGDKGGEVDTATGTFTFGAKEGYLIENGEVKGHLRDVGLSGSILGVLRRIKAIGREVKVSFPGYCGKGQWVPVDDGGPHILTRARVGGLG